MKRLRKKGRKEAGKSDEETRRALWKEFSKKQSEQRSTLDRIQDLKAKLHGLEDEKQVSDPGSLDGTRLQSFLNNEMKSLSEIQGMSDGTDSLNNHSSSK